MRALLVLAAVAVAVAAATGLVRVPGAGERGDTGGAASRAAVARVVDGDTLRVRRPGGATEPVRLIGIDTPELRPRGGGPPECFARAATRALTRLVAGRVVELRGDAEPRDRFGRRLAHLRRDGLDVNAWLVRNGFARTLEIPPNTSRADVYAGAESEARTAGRGLWAACDG